MLAGLAALAGVAPVHAAFTSTVGTGSATMTGNAASDIITISAAGSLLAHSRFGASDPGFASDTDFVTGDGGTVTTRPTSANLTVNAGGGNDTAQLLGPAGLTGGFSFDGGGGHDGLTVYDLGTEPRTFTVRPSAIEGAGGGAIGFAGLESLAVSASTQGDTIVVPGPLAVFTSLSTGQGDDTIRLLDNAAVQTVTLGDGTDTFDASALTRPVVGDLGEAANFRALATAAGASPGSAAAYTGSAFAGFERATGTMDLFLSTTATAAQLTGSRIGLGPTSTPDSAAATYLDTGADPEWSCSPACSRSINGAGAADLLDDLRAGDAFFLLSGTSGNVRGRFEFTHYSGTVSGVGSVAELENVLGGSADDTLIGHDGANRLDGNGGADVLSGTGGPDTLSGGAGADTIAGGDGDDVLGAADGGTVDLVRCGAGTDTVAADDVDDVNADCENVTRTQTAAPAPPPQPPPGSAPPGAVDRTPPLTDATFAATFLQTLRGAGVRPGASLNVARDRGAVVVVAVCRSATPCRTEARLFLGRAPANPFARRPAPGARGTLTIPAGEARTATLRLTTGTMRRLLRARRRRSAATLVQRTTDGAGRAQQTSTPLTLVGPRPRTRRRR